MEKEQPKTRKKIAKGKTWFTLHAPKLFNENVIGESVSRDGPSMIGRTIDMPLSEISGDVTKHHIKLKLKINAVTGEHASTEIISYELSKPYTQRMIRRRISKLDVICDVSLKDDKKYRIKVVGITLAKANSSKTTSLVREIEREIAKEAQNHDMDSLVVAFATGKIQREIQKRVSKIYPLRFLDVRKIEPLKLKKTSKKDKKETKFIEKPSKRHKEVEEYVDEPEEEPVKEENLKDDKYIEENIVEEQEDVKEAPAEEEYQEEISEEENIT